MTASDANPLTMTIPEAARLIGVSRDAAYEHVAKTGELAGVRVVKIGRRIVISRPLLELALGLQPDPSAQRPSTCGDLDRVVLLRPAANE